MGTTVDDETGQRPVLPELGLTLDGEPDPGTPPIVELRYKLPFITASDWELLAGVETDTVYNNLLHRACRAARDALRRRPEDRSDPADDLRIALQRARDLDFPVPWEAARWLEYAALALLARPHLGMTSGWTPEAYETLTYTWRKVIGEVHPGDEALPDDGLDLGPKVRERTCGPVDVLASGVLTGLGAVVWERNPWAGR